MVESYLNEKSIVRRGGSKLRGCAIGIEADRNTDASDGLFSFCDRFRNKGVSFCELQVQPVVA